jgi:hypothetical protein
MTSSTSHSEPRVPLLTLKLLAIAVTAWLICAAYTLWLNPEVRFYTAMSAIQDKWSNLMTREHGNKVVVYGGSSCMFSIIGEQMLEKYELPTVNRGLGAAMAVKIPTLHAIQDMTKGDTLIVAVEPGQFTHREEVTALAIQFSYAKRHPEWAIREYFDLPAQRLSSSLLALRPGSYHTLTLIGKLMQGRDLYRYHATNANPSGWCRTDFKLPLDGPPGHGQSLSNDARKFFVALREWGETRGIRIAYSLPWGYCPQEHLESFRKQNANTLLQISEFIPVLKDTTFGADPNPGHFADTAWHLNEEGSRLRTDQLGNAITRWEVWSPEELKQFAQLP